MNEALVNSMPFAQSLGLEITRAEPACVEGQIVVRDDLCTIGNSVHGGVLMTFADYTLCAIGKTGSTDESIVTVSLTVFWPSLLTQRITTSVSPVTFGVVRAVFGS